MKRMILGCAALAIMVLSGCSESVLVRSYPPGAKLFVNDTVVGLTPTVFSAPHAAIDKPYRVRLERDGYQNMEDLLRTRICGGRIAGGIFTLGISLIIRGPRCFASPQDFSLEPAPAAQRDSNTSAPSVEERLQRIERMRREGKIDQQEYDRYRKQILDGL